MLLCLVKVKKKGNKKLQKKVNKLASKQLQDSDNRVNSSSYNISNLTLISSLAAFT